MGQNYFTRKDLIEKLNISPRNLKFWTAVYSVPTKKTGRRTLYPALSFELLRIISQLSESRLFTMKLIRQIVSHIVESSSNPEQVSPNCVNLIRKKAAETLRLEEETAPSTPAPPRTIPQAKSPAPPDETRITTTGQDFDLIL